MKRLAFLFIFLCGFASASWAQDRLRVVTTSADLRSLVKAVGAERVIVSSLVPPGERVEDYQPRLQDIAILKGARAVVRAGSGIDPWFDKLLARAAKKNGRTGIERGEGGHIDASIAIANDPLGISAGFAQTRRASRGSPNLHYWLDPKTADTITAEILKTFSTLDPANRQYYENNRRAFLDRLNSKLSEWTSRLAPLRGEPIVAFWDDWGFFADRFGLNIVDFIVLRDRAHPKRWHMRDVTKLMKEKKIKLIISEAGQPERHVNRIARQTGAKVVELAGSVGMLPNTDDYIALFDANVHALVTAHGEK
ncbi:MAG: metal ABC transporter substrate-binding protein [Pseudorhodoplanes sp.]|jgi:ABC-type Zn uptake system ZnuABC Zn-binding protein ZnuA|nr:metal ABC transporter substrate-binding protein [Pseudorhodoplanes sp.]